jgi:putative CocE/NonD family hydrolase
MEPLQGIAPYYYEWMQHPPNDPWWEWTDLHGKYGRTQAAILNLSGWYDDNYGPEGATTNFGGLVAARGGQAERTELLFGPWVHGVDATGTAKAGERLFSEQAKIDYDATVLDWMDRYLRGIDNGVDKKLPVRYYVMGAEMWQESQTWPPASKPKTFYLGLAASGKTGALTENEAKSGSTSSFVSDPARPVTNKYDNSGAHDYRDLVARSDLLTFDTQPLLADTEVTGPIASDIFLSCDCKDVDVWARLYDVAPDSGAWNLMSPGADVQRASYRDMEKGRQLLRPGQIYEIRIQGPVTSSVFKKGHRIRIQVSGSFFPNSRTGDSVSKQHKSDDPHLSRPGAPLARCTAHCCALKYKQIAPHLERCTCL